jgi:hypothetical protein
LAINKIRFFADIGNQFITPIPKELDGSGLDIRYPNLRGAKLTKTNGIISVFI